MRKIFAVGLVVALAVGVWSLPAEAKGRSGGFHHGGRFHGGPAKFHGGHGHGFRHGGHFHGGHFHGSRVVVGFGFYGGWPYWGYPYPYYGYPYYYPPAVVYNAPTTVYSAPPAYTNGSTQSAPAIQREVVYPHGKYVLEGDGVNTPYKWVWIANSEYRPTEPPKSDAPGAAPPGPPPSR
jgi:hypothetical protein